MVCCLERMCKLWNVNLMGIVNWNTFPKPCRLFLLEFQDMKKGRSVRSYAEKVCGEFKDHSNSFGLDHFHLSLEETLPTPS